MRKILAVCTSNRAIYTCLQELKVQAIHLPTSKFPRDAALTTNGISYTPAQHTDTLLETVIAKTRYSLYPLTPPYSKIFDNIVLGSAGKGLFEKEQAEWQTHCNTHNIPWKKTQLFIEGGNAITFGRTIIIGAASVLHMVYAKQKTSEAENNDPTQESFDSKSLSHLDLAHTPFHYFMMKQWNNLLYGDLDDIETVSEEATIHTAKEAGMFETGFPTQTFQEEQRKNPAWKKFHRDWENCLAEIQATFPNHRIIIVPQVIYHIDCFMSLVDEQTLLLHDPTPALEFLKQFPETPQSQFYKNHLQNQARLLHSSLEQIKGVMEENGIEIIPVFGSCIAEKDTKKTNFSVGLLNMLHIGAHTLTTRIPADTPLSQKIEEEMQKVLNEKGKTLHLLDPQTSLALLIEHSGVHCVTAEYRISQ